MSKTELPRDLRRAEYVPIIDIEPHPIQPRKEFDEEKLEKFADTLEEWGLLQPIRITPNGDDGYYIVFGERRWRAAKRAGMDYIPAEISNKGLTENLTEMLIENVHREELSALEKGLGAYQVFLGHDIDLNPDTLSKIIHSVYDKGVIPEKHLNVAPGATIESNNSLTTEKIKKICNSIGKSPRTIRQWLEAISVTEEVQYKAARSREAPAGQAMARISTIDDPDIQSEAYDAVLDNDLNQDQASKMVTDINSKEADLSEGFEVEVEKNEETGEVSSVNVTPMSENDKINKWEQEIEKIEDDEGNFIFNETTDKLYEKVEDRLYDAQRYLQQPEQQRRTAIDDNCGGHLELLKILDEIFCPLEGANSPRLIWAYEDNQGYTQELPIEEAIELAWEQYKDEFGGEGIDIEIDFKNVNTSRVQLER